MELEEAIASTLAKGLEEDELWRITELATERTYEGGDTLVRQFDRDSDLIIILEGSAKVTTFGDELIAELGPGSIVGEISLVDERPRSATVRSANGATAAVIPSGALRELLEDEPAIAAVVYRNIAQTLCSRLRVSTIHLDGLMTARSGATLM